MSKLAEGDWGTKEKTCKCSIYSECWCWKAQRGLSAKAECPWRTGAVFICILTICLITQLHVLKPYSAFVGYRVEEETKCSISTLNSKTERWWSNKEVTVWDSKFKGSEGARFL